MSTHFFTSVAVNYLPKARVLARSINHFHPDVKIHLVLCDAVPSWFSLDEEPFDELWTLRDLDVPADAGWLFEHTLVELSTAVKGFALVKLLDEPGCERVLYLDPDIVVLAPMTRLLDEFRSGSILLTPHVTEPDATLEAIEDHEVSALRYGTFNLGFLGVRKSGEGRRFAEWWRDRLRDLCFDNIPGGLFTDQRWADLVPSLFPDSKVLRDAGYNVCTWNLTHRTVAGAVPYELTVNGEPLVFYHFSGLDRGAQKIQLDKYGSEMPALYELREWYLKACNEAGQAQLSASPWAYGRYSNGRAILPQHRKRYRQEPALRMAFPDPFLCETSAISFVEWVDAQGAATLFERDEERGGQPARPYRIFLVAGAGDSRLLSETTLSLQRTTFARMPWTLETGDGLASYDDLLSELLRRRHETDLIIVRAGVRMPEYWDLRLAWSAARREDAATVSPLDRRWIDADGSLGTLERTDRLCYWFRAKGDVVAETFSADCFYVRADALARMTETERLGGWRDLVGRAERYRYAHLVGTHVCVDGAGPRQSEADTPLVREVRERLRSFAVPERLLPKMRQVTTQPNLHLMHSLGGGTEVWLRDYCAADDLHEQLVLRSFGAGSDHGRELRLYRFCEGGFELLSSWPMNPPIRAVAGSHSGYRTVLREIVAKYAPGRVLISSTIGHGLDCFRMGLPITFICHDYFPYCQALNLRFGEICRSCEPMRLQACVLENPLNRAFPNVPATEWLQLRREFLALVKESRAALVAPSPSVVEHYSRFEPSLRPQFRLIPHGLPKALSSLPRTRKVDRPFRIAVVGALLPFKGEALLLEMLPEITAFAEVILLGCGKKGADLAKQAGVRTIEQYARVDLRSILENLQPDVGLLLSIWPETFSYTLHELMSLAMPMVATRVGAFADAIKDGVNGFLVEPRGDAIVACLRRLADDREALDRVHRVLRDRQNRRSTEEMVRDYEAINETRFIPERYFAGPQAPAPLTARSVQLYWDQGAGCAELMSMRVWPRGWERQKLRLFIPPQRTALKLVRLDLSTEPGFMRLYAVEVLDRNERPIWTWDGTPAEWARMATQHVTPLPDEGEGSLMALTGADPYVILPLDGARLASLAEGGSVTLEFSPIDNSDGQLPGLLIQVTEEARRERELRLQTEQKAGRERQQWAARLEEQEQQRAEEAELLHAKHGQLQAEGEDLKAMAQRLQALNEGLQSSVSWRLTAPLREMRRWLGASKDSAP